MIPNATTGVTGTGAISIMNNPNRLKKHFFLTCMDCLAVSKVNFAWGRAFTYKLIMTSQNHSGLITTMYMPIKQPGETGPKPIIAKIANMERHLICVKFINVNSVFLKAVEMIPIR